MIDDNIQNKIQRASPGEGARSHLEFVIGGEGKGEGVGEG